MSGPRNINPPINFVGLDPAPEVTKIFEEGASKPQPVGYIDLTRNHFERELGVRPGNPHIMQFNIVPKPNKPPLSGNSARMYEYMYPGAGSGESPIEVFAKSLDINAKPSDPIYKALEGVDPDKLKTFMINNAIQSATAPRHADGTARSGAEVGAIFINALKSTNGPDGQANTDFARHIRSAMDVALASLRRGYPERAARLEMSASEVEGAQRGNRDFTAGIDHAGEEYINSQGGSLETLPQAGPAGQRRHFNRAQLTEAQHIVAGSASVAEVKGVQTELKAEGYNLGEFGTKHDGVDGVAGKFTKGAIAQAMKPITP